MHRDWEAGVKEVGWVGVTNYTESSCVLVGVSGQTGRWKCLRSTFVGPGRDVIKQLGLCPVSAGE